MTLLPGAAICDITHEIAPFNLWEAAFVAKSTCFKFPRGSIHIIGVDPEGGSRLNTVVMALEGHFFVAPDNGVLSLIRDQSQAECIAVNPDAIPVPVTGRAFLAQYCLAPVAAALANGKSLKSLGSPLEMKDYRRGEPSFTENTLRGSIVHIDHFGNALTNIQKAPFMELKGTKSFQIFVRNLRLQRIVDSYGDVSKGEALALFSDNGHLEIAIREGSAAQLLRLKAQDMLTIEFYG